MTIDPYTSLSWQIDMGVDITIGHTPVDRLRQEQSGDQKVASDQDGSAPQKNPEKTQKETPQETTKNTGQSHAPPPNKPIGQQDALIQAKQLAASANNLNDLQRIIQEFDGFSIKQMAMNCVFADGPDDIDQVKVMVIGEAPGADEDRQGRPFVGKSGQLLDKMLASIGLNRKKNAYITNVLNWRPPGNRTPTDGEISLSKPFIKRHIELVKPPAILLTGGIATKAFVTNYSSLGQLRGDKINILINDANYPARATYHPAYLLRRPAHKRRAWQDLLQFKVKHLSN